LFRIDSPFSIVMGVVDDAIVRGVSDRGIADVRMTP